MTDLRDLMHDASTPERDWLADPNVLLRQGRSRVRRRRYAVVAATTAAVVVIAGGAWTVGHTLDGSHAVRPQDPSKVPTRKAESTGARFAGEKVSVEEAQRRCRAMAPHLHWSPDVVAPEVVIAPDDGGGNAQVELPWHVGDEILIAEPGVTPSLDTTVECKIPDAGMESVAGTQPTSRPRSDDPADYTVACGQSTGIDFGRWKPLGAVGGDVASVAAYTSSNGWVAECEMRSVGHSRPTAEVKVERIRHLLVDGDRAWGLNCQSFDEANSDQARRCFGTGYVGDATATRARVTYIGGGSVTVPVVDGFFCFYTDRFTSPLPRGHVWSPPEMMSVEVIR